MKVAEVVVLVVYLRRRESAVWESSRRIDVMDGIGVDMRARERRVTGMKRLKRSWSGFRWEKPMDWTTIWREIKLLQFQSGAAWLKALRQDIVATGGGVRDFPCLRWSPLDPTAASPARRSEAFPMNRTAYV